MPLNDITLDEDDDDEDDDDEDDDSYEPFPVVHTR